MYLAQHRLETEPAKVRDASQHHESQIQGHKEVYPRRFECRDQVRSGGSSSDGTSQEESRGHHLLCRRANRQA